MNDNGMGYVGGGWVILAVNNLLAGRGFSPRTAIGAALAALMVGVLPDPLGKRFGQVYFALVLITHGAELLQDIGFTGKDFSGAPNSLSGTVTNNADGSYQSNNPDGSINRFNPDGTVTNILPDGSTMTINKDGSVTRTDAQGNTSYQHSHTTG